MGKLIKNHLARLLILVASAYQTLAAIYAFFWPKIFFDFLTTNLDPIVKPIPALQIVNLLLGLLGLAWEWPLPLFTTASIKAKSSPTYEQTARKGTNGGTADTTKGGMEVSVRAAAAATTAKSDEEGGKGVGAGTKFLAAMHRSIEARLMLYPLSCLASLLLYQATNAGLYYFVGMIVYFWAFSEGEVVMGVPWTLPRKGRREGAANA